MNTHTEAMFDRAVMEIFNTMGNTVEAWEKINRSMGELGVEFADYHKPRPKGFVMKYDITFDDLDENGEYEPHYDDYVPTSSDDSDEPDFEEMPF